MINFPLHVPHNPRLLMGQAYVALKFRVRLVTICITDEVEEYACRFVFHGTNLQIGSDIL
jgi:hypothetical protein